jgi:hypothetical protein
LFQQNRQGQLRRFDPLHQQNLPDLSRPFGLRHQKNQQGQLHRLYQQGQLHRFGPRRLLDLSRPFGLRHQKNQQDQ